MMDIAHYRSDKFKQVEPIERKPPVMALHCSGSNAEQWSALTDRFWPIRAVLTPDLLGTARRGHYQGSGGFRLEQEARHPIAQLEMLPEPAHLVGHSYGGALALHIARARPDLVRSLCLYEPTLFSLLDRSDDSDQCMRREIMSLARAIRSGIDAGCSAFSAEVFTDFWGGLGAWQALNSRRRDAMISWIQKAPHDFDALLNEHAPEWMIAPGLPVSIYVGSQTHAVTARIATLLSLQSANVTLVECAGAGHLGPFTYREKFVDEIHCHLEQHEAAAGARARSA